MKKHFISLTIPLTMLFTYHEYIKLSRVVIEGTVVSEAQTPVADAFVYTVPGEEETLTDKTGRFKLTTWQSLPLTVTVEHRDFKTTVVNVTKIPANQLIRLKKK